MTSPPLIPDLDGFRARVVQDGINSALSATWERRAGLYDAARPRAGDFHGSATHADLTERDKRCSEIAEACRARASVSLTHELIDPDVWQAVRDD